MNKTLYTILSFILLTASLFGALFLVNQRQYLRQRAATVPGPTIVIRSQSNQGLWRQVSFDAYQQGSPSDCNGISASQCTILPYSLEDGWTNLQFDDSSWTTKPFSVDSDWWSNQGWDCSRTHLAAGNQIIGPIQPQDGRYPDQNDVTALHRRQFQIPNDVSVDHATLKFFSDNKTITYINGHKIDIAFSEVCYESNIPAGFLSSGENILAVQLSNDAVNQSDNPLGMAYELTIFTTVTTQDSPTPTSSPAPSPTATPTTSPQTCEVIFTVNAPTSTSTPSPTPSNTATPTPTFTPTLTPTGTLTSTNTPTLTPTGTLTPTNTPTLTPTGTQRPTSTPQPTLTSVPTSTPTQVSVNTPTPTKTPTPVVTTASQPETPTPTRIVLPDAGVDFPAKALTIIGSIITLFGLLILL